MLMPEPIRVPPQLPRKLPAPIAFVGEAPSTEELEELQPLVGPSGRLFNAMLRTAGLDREDYLVTNVFDEKLPNNNVAAWTAPMVDARAGGFADLPPLGSRGFLRPDRRHHLSRLRDELVAAAPRVIVPLGGTALWAFTGSDQITAARGAVAAAKFILPGAKLLPTFHPMAVQHQWKFFAVVVGDFIKAQREAERGPEVILPKRELTLEPTLADIRAYLPRLLASDLLSVDIETGWGQITNIGFAPDAEHSLNVPFLDRRVPNRSYWKSVEEEVAAWDLVREILASPTPKVGQNAGAFDAYVLLRLMRMPVRNLRQDTRLLHHALNPELPKSLAFMGNSYASQGEWKSWGKRQKEKRDD